MKISIIGLNIFGIGGTSRSNLNTIYEFSKDSNNEITYYNFADFSKVDVLALMQREVFMRDIKYQHLNDIFKISYDESDTSLYIITRESFFGLGKFLRAKRPNAKILGEIHAPLAYLDDALGVDLPYFSAIRVATESIKHDFIKQFGYDNVFVQRVSLAHISRMNKFENSLTTNFVVFSRFFEKQKDVAYSLKLMDYLINYLGCKEIKFYIKGDGPAQLLYENLIQYYNLKEHVFVNFELPENYIYLSTARLETLGYSIVEAISEYKLACVYEGDDKVNLENFEEVSSISWLNKDLSHDANVLLQVMQKTLTKQEIKSDVETILKPSKDYCQNILYQVSKFSKRTSQASNEVKLSNKEISDIIKKLSTNTIEADDILSNLRSYYLKIKHYPIVGPILKNKNIRRQIKKAILAVGSSTQPKLEVKDDYFFIESFHGKNFSGDPKHLALAISEKYPEAKIFVSSTNQLVDKTIRSYGFETLRTGSKAYLETFALCKYIFINGNSLDRAGKSEKQIIIQTWHGFPIKKMVADLEDMQQREKELTAFIPRMKKWDYLLTSSDFHRELLNSSFQLSKNNNLKILNFGTPKNGYLIENKESIQEKEKIHLKYLNKPLDKDKKYILFCPTWRKNERSEVTSIDLKEVINQLPENYEIIVKLHPHEAQLRRAYSNLDARIHCLYNELVDIQELYLLSSILISDYSSAVFDYAHLHKKIILLQEDIEEYTHQIGMYFDSGSLLHLKGKNYTTEELVENILSSDEDEKYEYNSLIVKELLNKDSIHSANDILKEIGL
ncbi:CDP-glycerol glycerophosphotransferase family protein [Lactococcus petauri]|uniref:CDP-glycerol glycerophosphotransferase family protein n=1 Tax=Lactococcus petauri TaxID=1940789 RepID=UPI0038553EC0